MNIRNHFVSACLMVLLPSNCLAQGLTTEDVAAGFVQAVGICAQAMALQTPIAQLPTEVQNLIEVADSDMRGFASVAADRPVYSLKQGLGIVIVFESEVGKCGALAYGPRVVHTFNQVRAALENAENGYSLVRSEDRSDAYIRVFEKPLTGNRTARVSLDGGEPGMQGRMFRFPLLIAGGEVVLPPPE